MFVFPVLLQSALEVRWCADADISTVLFLRPNEEVPLNAAWLRRNEAIVFETHIFETDDDDKGTESWQRLNDLLPDLLSFLIAKIKVTCLFFPSQDVVVYYELICRHFYVLFAYRRVTVIF